MKRTKLMECARKSLVVLLTVAMVWSSLPTAQIAMALTEPVVQPTTVEQPVPTEDSAVENQAATKEVQPELPETAAEQVAPAEQGPAEKADAPAEEPAPGERVPADKPAEEKPAADKSDAEKSAPADQAAGGNPAPAEQGDTGKDESAPALTARDLKNAKLVKAKKLSDQEAAELLGADAAVLAEGANGPSSAEAADGSKIDDIKLSWLDGKGQNAVGDQLDINAKSNDKIDIRARIDMKLKGPKMYAPGKVRIRVPMSVLKTRDGYHAGTMVMSVPEAPGGDATFSYIKRDGDIIIINNVDIPGSSAMFFEFTSRDIEPYTIKAGTKAVVKAEGEVRAGSGELLTAGSNDATVTMNTSGRVAYPTNTVERLSDNAQNVPLELLPENHTDYVYCDFYSSTMILSGQPFDLEVRHDASGTKKGVRMLGIRDQYGRVFKNEGPDSAAMSVKLLSNASPSGDYQAFVHAYVAVPKSELPADGKHVFRDHVVYKMKTLDDGIVTTTDDEGNTGASDAEKVYAPLEFLVPRGHFDFSKRGSVPLSENGTMVSWGRPNTTALNQIQRGEEAEVSWYLRSRSFAAPYTWLDKNHDGKMTPSELEKVSFATQVEDSSLGVPSAGFGQGELTEEDYEFSSLEIKKPQAFHYEKYTAPSEGYYETENGVRWGTIKADSYGYRPVYSDKELPQIEIRGRIAGMTGDVRLAKLSWADSVAKPVELYEGVKLEGSVLQLPKGVMGVKAIIDSPLSAVGFEMYPTVRIKPSEKMRDLVQKVFDREENPSMSVRNNAKMTVTAGEDAEKPVNKKIEREADDALEGSVMGVWADQKISDLQNDTARGQVKMHVATVANEQSNIYKKNQYDQLVKDGAIQRETSGTFYELLPAGVVPVMESISLRDGDLLKSARVIKNYKKSGRSLLIVDALLAPNPYKASGENPMGKEGYRDAPVLEFDVMYPWEEMAENGKTVTIVAAFESGNSGLGTRRGLCGEPDNPLAGNNRFSRTAVRGVEGAMTDLDPDRDDASFVYARAEENIDVVTSGLVGFSKQVSVNGNGLYGTGLGEGDLNAYEGGRYSYRLRMRNDGVTKSDGIVFYDNLENVTPTSNDDAGDEQWKGTLIDIDVSALEASGVDPVVYYSTAPALDFSNIDSDDLRLSNKKTWSTDKPADSSLITAVAIDCSAAADGGKFVLDPGKAISAVITMKAPVAQDASWYDTLGAKGAAERGFEGGAHAYNEATMLAASSNADGTTAPVRKVVTSGITKVGLRNADIRVQKVWEDAKNQDGLRPDSLKVALVADGKNAVKTLDLDANGEWRGLFEDVQRVNEQGSQIEYSVDEGPVKGYECGVRWVSGDTPSDPETCTITNVHEPETLDFAGTKIWAGDEGMEAMRPASIRVELVRTVAGQEEPVAVKTVKPGSDGTWRYAFEDLPRYAGGKEIDYRVKEVDSLGAYEPSVSGADLVNTFLPEGTLKVTKQIEGPCPANAPDVFTFSLGLAKPEGNPDAGIYEYERIATTPEGSVIPGEGGTIANGGTFELAGGESIVIKGIPTGTSYKVEEEPTAGYKSTSKGAAGTVAGNDAHAEFKNRYSAYGALLIEAKKELVGRSLEGDQFAFELVDENGRVLRRARNEANGDVTFGEIGFTEEDAGKAFEYIIRERKDDKPGYTYDGAQYTVKVNPIDNGDGTITAVPAYYKDGNLLKKGDLPTFKNEYGAKGSLTVFAYKELEGRDLTEGEFTFKLSVGEGEEEQELARATNDKDGTVELSVPEVSLASKAWADGKPTILTVSEVPGDDPTVDYSEQKVSVEVTPHDDGAGKLTFDQKTEKTPVIKNKLKPGALRIEKRATGGDANQEFTFNVKLNGADGQELPGKLQYEVVNLENGASVEERIADRAAGVATSEAAAGGSEANPAPVDSEREEPAGDVQGKADSRRETKAPIEPETRADVKQGAQKEPAAASAAGKAYPTIGQFNGEEPTAKGVVRNGADGNTATWRFFVTKDDHTSGNNVLIIDKGVMNLEKIGQCGTDADGNDIPPVNEWITGLPYNEGISSIGTVLFNGTTIKCLDGAFVRRSGGPNEWGSLSYVGGTVDMRGCESAAYAFRGDRRYVDSLKVVDIEGFTAENATSCAYMFSGCNVLTSINLSSFKATNAADLRGMFEYCDKLATLDLSGVSSAVRTDKMFDRCYNLNTIKLGKIVSSETTSASAMFRYCWKLTQLDTSGFDTSNVTDMSDMFRECKNLSVLDVSKLDTSNAVTMKNMFYGCKSVEELDVSAFNTANVTDMSYMFSGCGQVGVLDVSGFNTSRVKDMRYMFNGCSKVAKLKIEGFDTRNVEDLSFMFMDCGALPEIEFGPKFKTDCVTNMGGMFYGCQSLSDLDVSSFNTSKVKSFDSFLEECEKLEQINLENFDTSSAQDMGGMFSYCGSLRKIELSDSFRTDNVKDFSSMFYGCGRLSDVGFIKNFETKNAEDMYGMFGECSSLTSIDLSGFNAERVTSMGRMFYMCSGLTSLDLSSLKPKDLHQMRDMFNGCTSLEELDISGLGTGSFYKGDFDDDLRIFGLAYDDESALKNLHTLRLGSNWRGTWRVGSWDYAWADRSPLPEMPADAPYGSAWVRDEDGKKMSSSKELCSQPSSFNLAGTWRRNVKEGSAVVSFRANLKGATGQMNAMAFEVKEGSTVTLPDCSFTHPKYNFDSWNTKADGTGKRCPAGVPIENFAKPGDKVTLYAQWKSKELPTAPVTNGEFEITIHAGEAAVIKDVPAGVGYTVTEKTPAGWKLVESAKTTGEIKTNEPAVATFLNAPNTDKPNAIEGSIAASKLLDGKPAPDGAFEFQLLENGKVLQAKKNGAGGGISFDPIEYTEAGEHTYQIKEVRGTDKSIVYDASDEEVKVAVTEGKDGKLSVTTEYTSQDDTAGRAVFHNKHADGSLTVTKAIEGDAPAGKTFGFRVDWDGGKTSDTFELRAGESKTFENVPAGTRYQVTEASMPGGFTQVSAKGDAGKIESGVAANAVITNKYGIAQGTFAVIEAFKVLEGAPLGADQFAFELLDAKDTVIATAKNGPDGSIMFDAQTYDAPGDYAYKVREVDAGEENIVYDGTVHTVTVHVTDNGDGTLSAQVDYGKPGKIVFHNQMTCKFIPTATKVLQGGELAQDQFTFELRNAEQGGDVISAAKNDAVGNIAFEPITYGASDVGKTFEYWISEVDDGQKGIAYDTKSVHVTVSVELDASGVITATAVYDGDPLATFTNVAVVDPGPEQPGPGKPDPEIPETGGPGIAGGILAGMAMVLLSAVEIVRRKRAQGM